MAWEVFNPMIDQRTYQAIKKAIILGIQRNGNRIFLRSLDTAGCFVPVDTGFLKSTGSVDHLSNGVEIKFAAPYSSDVEFGHEDRPINTTQRVYVRTYRRKDGSVVNGHWVEYKSKKVISWRPKISKFERGERIWRVLDKEPAQKGQLFLTRATIEKIQDLPTDIEFCLKQLENRPIK